jgi:hypothetical protein
VAVRLEARRVDRNGSVIVPLRESYWGKDKAVWRMGNAWRWWLVGNAGREVAGGRVAVTHAGRQRADVG